jgi:hypothetical protein
VQLHHSWPGLVLPDRHLQLGRGLLRKPIHTLYTLNAWLSNVQIWGAPFPNVTVAEDEEQLVAYCTTPNHGTRVLPPGAIQGVQLCVSMML